MSIANDVNIIIQRRNEKVETLRKQKEQIAEICLGLNRLQKQKDKMIQNSDKLKLSNESLECIQQLDLRSFQLKQAKLKEVFNNIEERFSRSTINIAVIGGARQGKSKFLQTISGLSNEVIPAFDTSDCTGATSMIKNVKGGTLRADITFKHEVDMIKCVQEYLDKIIGKDEKRISSFQEIASLDINAIKGRITTTAEMARLEHLEKYIKYFNEWSPYVGKSITVTEPEEIKKFVAQHNGKSESSPDREDYYKYLAVEKAEISCEFNYADAGKIVLQDTIGLGDTSLGIEKTMLDTVAKDSDAAIIIKRPEVGTGKFDNDDYELYKKLEENFQGRNMGKWLFWLINETDENTVYGDNHDRCESVESKIRKYNFDLAGYDIVNVADTEKVNNQFLHMVLSTLTANMDTIDNGLVTDLNNIAGTLYNEYENIQGMVQNILASEVKNSIDVYEFVNSRWYRFYNQTLMRKLKEYKEKWEEKSQQECIEFKECIENILDNARKNIPDIHELEWELGAGGDHGLSDVYQYHLDKLRTDFTEKFLNIDEEIFDKLINGIKEDIVNIFAEDDGGRMKYIAAIDANKPRAEWLSYAAIDKVFEKDRYSQFKTAFNILNSFKLTVRGFLMHKVRFCVRRLETGNGNKDDDKFSNTYDREALAKEVNWHLDKKIKEVSDELKYQLSDMYTDPNGILSSIIKEFYDRLNFSSITGKNTAENLWKNLYYEKCANVWGEEFNDVKEVSDIYNEWESLKTELNKYSKQDFVINI